MGCQLIFIRQYQSDCKDENHQYRNNFLTLINACNCADSKKDNKKSYKQPAEIGYQCIRLVAFSVGGIHHRTLFFC